MKLQQPCWKLIHTEFIKWSEPRHDKTNTMSVRPAKTQISLGIRPVWSESSLCTQWVAKDLSFLHADSEGSDQADLSLCWAPRHFVGFVMSRLIWEVAIGQVWLAEERKTIPNAYLYCTCVVDNNSDHISSLKDQSLSYSWNTELISTCWYGRSFVFFKKFRSPRY